LSNDLNYIYIDRYNLDLKIKVYLTFIRVIEDLGFKIYLLKKYANTSFS